MKHISRVLIIALFSIILFSCNKIPNHAKYIPKNALGVFSVDMDKLSKKLIWNVLTGSEIFDEVQKDVKNEESKKAMKDFSNIGLDPATTIYIFYTGNMKDENHPCLVAGMKDPSKFESFITKNYPEIKIDDNKDFKSCVVEKKFLLAWNKEAAIGTTIKQVFEYPDMPSDTNMAPKPAETVDAAGDITYMKELFALSSGNAITSLSNFKKLQKDGHDFSLWLNYEEFYKQSKELNSSEVKAFLKEDYFKDAALACGFDFEKGSVDMEMDYYLSGKLADIYKSNAGDNVDESLVKKIPSKDIDVLVTYNLRPKMVQEMLKEFKLDGLINLGLASLGVNMDNILEAFKGDIVFAMTDMKASSAPKDSLQGMYASEKPDFNITYAMTVNKVENLESLLAKGVEKSIITKNGNMYTLANSSDAGALMYDKEQLAYSNKIEIVKQFMEGKANAKDGIPADVWKNLSSNPVMLYADIKKIMTAVPMEGGADEKELMEEVKKMFTYAQVFGGKMKGNASHMEGNLYFTDKNENSMIQLIKLGIKAKKIEDKKKLSAPVTDTLNV